MSTVTWPCTACGAPGYRNLGTEGYCPTHYAEVVASFDPANTPTRGRGMPGRTINPDDLTCIACGYQWVGTIGELCWRCDRWHELAPQWQVKDLERRPDIDVEDERYEQVMTAWAKRLRTAVDGGVLADMRARAVIKQVAEADGVEIERRHELRSEKKAS